MKQRRPSPAIVVAVLALVAAVAGTAVAADPVANTAVGKKQTKKIAKKESKKFFNANIGDASVANAATADQLANVTVQKETFQVADNTANGAVASCPEGQQVISGGGITGANDSYITNSVPANAVVGDLDDGQTFTAWRVFVVNQLGQSGTITSSVYAVCAGQSG